MSVRTMHWSAETPLRRVFAALAVILAAVLLLSVTGCEINTSKNDASGKKNVEIKTPFGDMKVNNSAEAKDTGLPVYPGATIRPSESGDKAQANVSMSVGGFGMKLAVIAYNSDDAPDKVVGWYREQLKPMGSFIECTGWGDVGNVGRRNDKDKDDDALDKPVSCDKQGVSGNGRKVTELKLGTEGNQKIVAVSERKDGKPGSEFALVRVQLRGGKGDTL
jgi:hypothetical protein